LPVPAPREMVLGEPDRLREVHLRLSWELSR
jgi:hypothetical protein